MGLPQLTSAFDTDEYLSMERQTDIRHEFLDGFVYAMAGESLEHSTINANLTARLHAQLAGKPCRVLSLNLKVCAGTSGLYAYPDATVVCGQPIFHDEKRDVLMNPTLIVEVLSPSTEKYDRGEKFERYKGIESLTDYLLVSQDAPRVEHRTKNASGEWTTTIVEGLSAALAINSIECRLPLAEIHERVFNS